MEQIKGFQSNLKEVKENTNQQARFNFNRGIGVDTATWLLEAVLNFEYDRGRPNQIHKGIRLDSVNFPDLIALNQEREISLINLIRTYNYIADFCDSITVGSPKIKIIDIVEQRLPDGIRYKAYITLLENQRPTNFIPNCGPFTTEIAAWNYANVLSCPPPTTNDGPTFCENNLNCQLNNGIGCNKAGAYIFYSNVSTSVFGNISNTYPSALYYNGFTIPCGNMTINASNMNGYVTGSQSLAAANIPVWTGPLPNITTASYHITAGFFPLTITVEKRWWDLNVTYARAFCSNALN